MIDLLIKNGTIIDGTGARAYRGDIAVQADRIVDIGQLSGAEAHNTIEAEDLVVSPGFIDMHSHADFTLPVAPLAQSLVHQGITSVVVGQCGLSPAPLFDETRPQIESRWNLVEVPLPWQAWSSFGEYLAYLQSMGVSINVVSLVAHGTIRAGVIGFSDQPAASAEMARMQAAAVEAMEEGAIGVSTGLIYPPGSYASTEELVAFTRPVADRRGFYFSHIRGESETLLEAVAEALEIGRQTGASVQISHFKAAGRQNWDLAPEALALIDRAQDEGIEVSMDMYPYLAGSTFLTALLPEWAQDGGKSALLERLKRESDRAKMAEEMTRTGFSASVEWDKVLISSSPRRSDDEGQSIAELADSAGKTPQNWVFDALLETDLDVMMVSFMMSEDNLKLALVHPAMMIGTDGWGIATSGPLSGGKPHPRSYGTYPRVLKRYVREEGLLSLEQAIWKMTGLPARKLHWTDRGVLQKGAIADIVIFDAEQIADLATFQDPHRYPEGIPHVIVSGVPVIRQAGHTGARPGQILGLH